MVIPTFRRPAALANALEGLAGQEEPGITWDVVVVDNDDPPGIGAVVKAASERIPVATRLVREHVRGASAARNRGIAESTADVVVFLDDDVVPDRTWLRELVAPIVSGRSDGAGGRVVLDPSVARPPWLDEPGIGGYLTAFDLGPVERELQSGEFVVTASAAFRACALRAVGGFDVELGPSGRIPMVNDDLLLCHRFVAAGGRLRYVPGSLVVHELPPSRLTRRYLLRRAYCQGRSDWVSDRVIHGRRRAVLAMSAWIAQEARRRLSEGLWRAPVFFHAACDTVRVLGWLATGAAAARPGAGRPGGARLSK